MRTVVARSRSYRRWPATVGATTLLVVAAAGALMLRDLSDRSTLPDLDSFLRFELPSTGVIYDARGTLLLEVAREKRSVVSYGEIPAVVRQAVLAVEDKNFFSHRGVDVSVLPRVVMRNLRSILADWRRAMLDGSEFHVSFRQGGSTITQQVVRGFFLTDITRRENDAVLLRETPLTRLAALVIGVRATNKLWRKVEEIRLAVWLEDELTRKLGSRQEAKQLIFAHYANAIYLGNGRYGLAAASDYYFGRPLGSLTDADVDKAALLAATIKNPRAYAPSSPDASPVLQRRNEALALMQGSGYLSAAALRRWQQEPMPPTAQPAPKDDSATAVAGVFEELGARVAGYGVDDLLVGKIRVHTTLDARLQRITEDAVEEGLRRYEKRHPERRGETQAAAVVLGNANADVLAEVGGRRFYRGLERRLGDFNRATQAYRQPGSAFKPLVYLAAFRLGAELDTIVVDEPIAVATSSNREVKTIANYDHTFKGAIPLRQALAESRNAATVWIAQQVGLEPIRDIAFELGIHTPLQPYLSTALGSSEVTLIELANAYRAMASGLVSSPHVIDRLESAQGETLFRTPVARRLEVSHRALIQEALRGVVRLPEGTAHALGGRDFPIQVLGKTGTTSDFHDAVFVGSTYGPDGITVAVWIGNDDQQPLGAGETGARTALPIFREVMLKVYGSGPLGAPPRMPREIDRGIDEYLAGERENRDEVEALPASPTDSLLLQATVLGQGALAGHPDAAGESLRAANQGQPTTTWEREDRLGSWRCYADPAGIACARTEPAPSHESHFGQALVPVPAVLDQ